MTNMSSNLSLRSRIQFRSTSDIVAIWEHMLTSLGARGVRFNGRRLSKEGLGNALVMLASEWSEAELERLVVPQLHRVEARLNALPESERQARQQPAAAEAPSTTSPTRAGAATASGQKVVGGNTSKSSSAAEKKPAAQRRQRRGG